MRFTNWPFLTRVKQSPASLGEEIRRLWLLVFYNSILLNVLLSAISMGLLWIQMLPTRQVTSSLSALIFYFLRVHQGKDSWVPMLDALQVFFSHRSVYQTVFFAEKVKFQYPLTSLLPFYYLKIHHVSDQAVFGVMNAISWISVWATIAGSFLILELCLNKRGITLNPLQRVSIAGLTLLCGMTFYPLVKGYSLGQIQTVIDALFTFCLYFWMRGQQAASGVLAGVMSLIKPQYAVIALWMAIRRRWNALAASLIVGISGVGIAGLVFGWREQLDYLGVLSFMSRHGESYFANQSLNGLLHRLLFQGNSVIFQNHTFAPYSPLVYFLTVASSLVLVVAALSAPRMLRDAGSVRDLARMALVATMASPIVWEHHYGITLAIFGYLAGTLTQSGLQNWLLAAFVLISTSWNTMSAFANVPVLNILQSLCFLGALILLGILFKAEAPGKVTNTTYTAESSATHNAFEGSIASGVLLEPSLQQGARL